VPGWVIALLRVPLAGKLAGANALIVLAVTGAAIVHGSAFSADSGLALLFAIALGGSLTVNVALVIVALRPLRDLEHTAERIWSGDLGARVPSSLLADAELARLGSALNVLLDGLTSDREQMRRLASEVIRAGDRERAYIARELHDGTAQTLAALLFQVSVLERENAHPEMQERLTTIRQITSDVLEEVRTLAHTVHPRVLDDLGLVAALRHLARLAEDRSSADIEVDAERVTQTIPPPVAAVLYRVAQEAVGNALRHAAPTSIIIHLEAADGRARMQVVDDGRGFDVPEAERRRPGMGLFTMRERVALVEGRFDIVSAPGRGTSIVAEVSFDPRNPQ
jgi:signal transduction histidine kinase